MLKRWQWIGSVAAVLVTTVFLISHADVPAMQSSGAGDKTYLAHVSTDKPIYRVGETVYLRAVLLGANEHKPMQQQAWGTIQITGPNGEVLGNFAATTADSVLAFNWPVPLDAGGGVYKTTVQFPAEGFPPAQRTFEVRAYRTPRLKGEIIFLRDGYGPGDTVQASMHVQRAEGGIPAGADVMATAMVDGGRVYEGQAKVDGNGNVSVQFALPRNIDRGDGTLTLAVQDGGVVEPISKTIPILLKTIDVAFYPEGGDLVAGLDQRVYLEARTAAQKPADLVGEIVDSAGHAVAQVKTVHEGRGRFSFVPTAGEHYALKILQPSGIDKTFALPDAIANGVVLSSQQDIVDGGGAVKLSLAATDAGRYWLTLSKHGVQICSLALPLAAGDVAHPVLTPPTWADGVLVATVSDSDGKPLAERLIFRRPARGLHVSVTADKPNYVPGQAVKLTVKTTDDDGNPVGAIVALNVTDDSVLRMIEQRDRAPRLLAMVLLEDDVRELADADVYLNPLDPKSAAATDLLLGTQGWRRFAFSHPDQFKNQYGDQARRVLADLEPQPQAIGGFGGGAIEFAAQDRAAMRFPMSQAELQRTAAVVVAPSARAAAPPAIMDVPWNDLAQQKMLPPPPMYARIYAHDESAARSPDERTDFTETVFWAAGLKTDDKTGTASVSFKLSDSVTTFRATADAFDSDGLMGQGDAMLVSVKPFYIEPKLPLEVSAGDEIQLPVALVNSTETALNVALSTTTGQGIWAAPVDPLTLGAGQRGRQIVDVTIGAFPGQSDFIVHADAGSYSDEVTRTLVVKPLGFPIEWARGGLIDTGAKVSYDIQIPQDLVAGSVHTSIALYPTPLGNLTEALRRLLQEPYGCFEQTSSTTYPLVMADQYFQSHTGVDPSLIAQSNDLLAKGYTRLLGFECQNKGYEWFGEDPGHECLTAFGLLEFTDMSHVRQVDAQMLADTRNWLMSHRDGKGGFTHDRRALHTWITDPDCANGYCTWALLECGQTGLDREVNWLRDHAMNDPNSYVAALAANVMYLAGQKDAAKVFMDRLAREQDKDGHVLDATTSIVGSEGDSLDIETTSLATLAWLRDRAYVANAQRAIEYLADSCKDGRYGSTQSTVLALRAIVTYDKLMAHPTAPGNVQLILDGRNVGDAVAFDSTTQGAIKLPDLSRLLTPGPHTVQLAMTNGSSLPYAIAVDFNSTTPDSSSACKLSLAVSLKDSSLDEGAATEVDATVINKTDQILPTPIAIIGLPGGLEVRQDQLKELVKAGRIAAFEVRGREVILYWRDMQPRAALQIPLSVVATVPGTYTAPASRAYLYYADDYKDWVPGVQVRIAAR
ncbi:MAG TPA: MG2 domain-containing protein [Tepidisphaeraceae bacterium]|nr:MG2 domain-containing protein [Tepidisphaeraceae bacterium]